MRACQAFILLVALSLGHAINDGADDVGFVQAKLQKHYRTKDKLPNVGWVGKGYDIFRGNPHEAGGADPGFKQRIFALSYEEDTKTLDGRYTIPDRTYGIQTGLSCTSKMDKTDVSSAKAFSDSLSAEVSGSVNGAGAKFSAGGSYKSIEKETTNNEHRFLEMKAQCSVYKIEIDKGKWPPLAEGFVTRLARLPASFSENPEPFYEFIDDYGTHVATAIEMGGREGFRDKFDKKLWQKSIEKGWSANAAGEYAPPAGVGGGGSAKVESNSQVSNELSQATQSRTVFSQGGKYNEDATKWAETLKTDPYPIKYELKELWQVINTDSLPADTELQVDQVVQELKTALENYCEGHLMKTGELTTCDPPPDIPVFEREALYEWATMTMDKTVSEEPEMCPEEQWVDRVRMYEQGGYGVVGLEFHCSEDDEERTTIMMRDIAKNGLPKEWRACSNGFTQMQGKEQGRYGIVDAKLWCDGDGRSTTPLVNNDEGDWTNHMLKCPTKQVIVGFQTKKSGSYGLVDFTVTCSNAPAVQAARAQYAA